LNPRFTTFRNVAEPFRIHGLGKDREEIGVIARTLESVELRPAEMFLMRYPHQLSGGQRQRVSLARCLVTNPRFIVADEPVSMLDVSIRASFLELLKNLRLEQKVTVLYISHNLSEIRYISQKMAVMYLGKIVEIGITDKVIDNPKHPYTQKLVSAVPIIDPNRKRQRITLEGKKPDLVKPPLGCRFQSMCKYTERECYTYHPKMVKLEEGHEVACHLYSDHFGQQECD
jgi:oligopeptide/dipeptide ABC transporter ATP-binding protein